MWSDMPHGQVRSDALEAIIRRLIRVPWLLEQGGKAVRFRITGRGVGVASDQNGVR
jgi:hypothetical protein